MAQGFPIDAEEFLASIVEVLKENGDAREVAIISNAFPELGDVDQSSWSYDWRLTLLVDVRLFTSLRNEQAVEEAGAIIFEAGKLFLASYNDHRLHSVSIAPATVKNERWREDAKKYLSGEGINNQGRVRSDNIASRQHDGLLFRSRHEINLYKAFKALGVTLAPLPVFVVSREKGRHMEPDFLIIKDGITMVVEVDGPYHRESPVAAHARLQPLRLEGVEIERVNADDCETEESAKVVAVGLLQNLERISKRVR